MRPPSLALDAYRKRPLGAGAAQAARTSRGGASQCTLSLALDAAV